MVFILDRDRDKDRKKGKAEICLVHHVIRFRLLATFPSVYLLHADLTKKKILLDTDRITYSIERK